MKTRKLNGYIAIYVPEHPHSYQNDNWKGWVYEHRYIAENIDFHYHNDDNDTICLILHPQTIEQPNPVMEILLDTIATHSQVLLKYVYLDGWRFDVRIDK